MKGLMGYTKFLIASLIYKLGDFCFWLSARFEKISSFLLKWAGKINKLGG